MRKGLTFNDVLLVPKKTPLHSRSEALLHTRFTKNISLNIPLVSANMSSVTESRLAIALARHGGIGIIHQFNTIEEQVQEVKKVKRSTSYVVESPLSLSSSLPLSEALLIFEREHINSALLLDEGVFVGLVTRRDYLFEKNTSLPLSSLMTPRKKVITAPPGISLENAKSLLYTHRIEKLPLVEGDMVKGLITSQDIKKLEYWPFASRDTKGRLLVGAALGVKDTLERAGALVKAGADVLVLDVAHCHSDLALQCLRELKSHFTIDVMAGNIATADAAFDLIQAGADGLKVGIGPSPVCTTRIMSGAGVPQVTATQDVFSVARKYYIPVCTDGGMKYPGDVAKALAAGADSIMSGSLFSGTDETPGFIVFKDGKRYKRYMGSASYDSNHERQELVNKKKYRERLDVFVEGISTLVPYKGPVEEVIFGLLKGIRSGLSYCGSRTIQEMHDRAELMEMTSQGFYESGPREENFSE